MQKTYLKLFSFCLTLFAFNLPAQVSFTAMSNLLGSGNGIEDCAVDMNGDYLDDIVRVSSAGVRIDFQQADGTFVSEMFSMNLQAVPSWSICAGDLNDDGFNDLLLGDGNRVSFIMAQDNGASYVEQAIPDYIFSQRTTMNDIDNDGDLDAFVCHDVDQSHPYRNDGTGNMVEDQTLIETVPLAGNYASIWVDYDNDGNTDMYLTKCRQGSSSGDIERTNAMYRNNGDGTYTEVGAAIGMADNAQSWATTFEDYDNDGDFDAFIVNHDFANRFMRNNGDGTFTDIIGETGIPGNDLGAWENASADFNNDGFVDILSELSKEIYINNGDFTFTGIDFGFDDGGIGDFNNDGWLDIVSGNTIQMNNAEGGNNWVKINTQGIVSNRNGIGARVEIHGDWGIQVREVRSGESFSPMSSLTTHFGLGEATEIDQIIIRWPSGIITSVDNPTINTTHLLLEAECVLDPSVIVLDGENTICPGDVVTINAPDAFDSYIWSNGETGSSITVSTPGTYSVALFDAEGCASVSNSIGISYVSQSAPTIAIDGELVLCEGESVTLTSSIGASYTWTNSEETQSIEVSTAGAYSVGTANLCSDELLYSEPIVVMVNSAPAPTAEDAVANFDGTVELSATGQNLNWYDAPTEGTLLGSGSVFNTDINGMATDYYVDATYVYGGGNAVGGKLTTSGGGGLPSTGAYSYFDTYEPFTIVEVDVEVPSNAPEGIRTIQLFDGSGQMLESATFDLVTGLQTITLNFEIPEEGTDYSLRCVENNLFRNNGGVDYPYEIGDLATITTSFYGDQYYYYFYNWKVEKPSISCISERTEVSVTLSGVDNLTQVTNLEVFPNPTSEVLNIRFTAETSEAMIIRLTDVLGRTIQERALSNLNVGENMEQLNVSKLPTGVYNLQLNMGDKNAYRKVVVD